MTSPHDIVADQPTASLHADVAPMSCIDLDRFCEGCAYNLRTLPVQRDPGTGIPVVRCTECGRCQPANDGSTAVRPWLNRVTSLLLGAWIFVVIGVFVSLGFAEGGISYGTLDELTGHTGSQTVRINNTTTTTWGGYGPLEVRADVPDYALFAAVFVTGSLAIGFACGMFAVVVCPHWPRAGYFSLVAIMPLVAGGMIALAWSYDAPHLFAWGMRYVVTHAVVQVLGGIAGITFGRAAARTTVRIFLTDGIRPRLAYLWLVDGKPFPHR